MILIVHTATTANIDIPRATAELKAQIEDFIPRCTGLTLKRVRILVDRVNVRGVSAGYGIPGPETVKVQPAPGPKQEEAPARPAAPQDHQRRFSAEETPAAAVPVSVEPLPAAGDEPETAPAEPAAEAPAADAPADEPADVSADAQP